MEPEAADAADVARWKSALYGFVELNAMHDCTQSYGPSANNAMLARPGTYAGPARAHAAHRQQLAVRLADGGAARTTACAPTGQFEVDFFGAQPTDATEQTIYAAPSLRMRLFYLRLKAKLGWDSSLDLLAGQYHDLFAWGGAGFYPNSVAFLGIAGRGLSPQPAGPR